MYDHHVSSFIYWSVTCKLDSLPIAKPLIVIMLAGFSLWHFSCCLFIYLSSWIVYFITYLDQEVRTQFASVHLECKSNCWNYYYIRDIILRGICNFYREEIAFVVDELVVKFARYLLIYFVFLPLIVSNVSKCKFLNIFLYLICCDETFLIFSYCTLLFNLVRFFFFPFIINVYFLKYIQ